MAIFQSGFGSCTYDGDTIEAEFSGFRFVATVHHDSDYGAPWEESDCHGPVIDWTRRDKLPGELVLCEDRGSKRFYDFAAACRIARKDGWRSPEDAALIVAGYDKNMTKRAIAARAAHHDYDVLRAWCNSDWAYCGIAVQVFGSDDEELTCEYDFALWGVEMNYPGSENSYLLDVANELADEAYQSAILPLVQAAATVTALQDAGI
jgi:hypothetical protein